LTDIFTKIGMKIMPLQDTVHVRF